MVHAPRWPARLAARWARMVAGHSLRTMVLTGLAALIVLTAAGAAVIYHGIIVTRRSGEEIARSIEIRAAVFAGVLPAVV